MRRRLPRLLAALPLVLILLLTAILFRYVHADAATVGIQPPAQHLLRQESPLSPLAIPAPENDQGIDAVAAAGEAPRMAVAHEPVPVVELQGPITVGTTGNQTSVVLVGAILIGIIVVAGLAVWRRP